MAELQGPGAVEQTISPTASKKAGSRLQAAALSEAGDKRDVLLAEAGEEVDEAAWRQVRDLEPRAYMLMHPALERAMLHRRQLEQEQKQKQKQNQDLRARQWRETYGTYQHLLAQGRVPEVRCDNEAEDRTGDLGDEARHNAVVASLMMEAAVLAWQRKARDGQEVSLGCTGEVVIDGGATERDEAGERAGSMGHVGAECGGNLAGSADAARRG